MGSNNGTQFKRQTDLKRSSGLRLSTPVRSLVERVAKSAGLTYSDAIRLLVEEALAARAGERTYLGERLEESNSWLRRLTAAQDQLWKDLFNLCVQTTTRQESADKRQDRTEQKIDIVGQQHEGLLARIDAMQRQIKKVLDLLTEKEAGLLATKLAEIERYLRELSGGGYGIWHYTDLDGG